MTVNDLILSETKAVQSEALSPKESTETRAPYVSPTVILLSMDLTEAGKVTSVVETAGIYGS